MKSRYFAAVLGRPVLTLACAALVVFALGLGVRHFRLDASPESLVLEQDRALQYHRSISARYGSQALLAVVYTPRSKRWRTCACARPAASKCRSPKRRACASRAPLP